MTIDPKRVTVDPKRVTMVTHFVSHPPYRVRLDGKIITERLTPITHAEAVAIAEAYLNPAPAVRYVPPTRGPKRKGESIQPTEDE